MTKINQFIPQIAFHPGETLAEKLNELGMGPKEFSIRTDKPEKTIIAVLNGKSALTPEMAVQFEHVLKIPAHFWLNLQRNYDEFIAREKQKQEWDDTISWTKHFPISEMIRLDWIPSCSSWEEKTSALLDFFGISNHKAWENYYLNQQLKVTFRISLVSTKEPYAISAWLRKGELQALEHETTAYSENRFKEILPRFKSLMAEQPDDSFSKLQVLCEMAGVKLVYTPCLQKADVGGSTRWLKDTPLIQMSGRLKRNDLFWFSFFHLAGHILLHNKKDIFLENLNYAGMEKDKEKEADDFAMKWILAKKGEEKKCQFITAV